MGNQVCCQTSCWPWMNPRFRLRTQLYFSFGMTTLLSVAAVCCIAVWTTYNSAQSVEQQAKIVVENLVVHTLGGTAQYVAETLTKQFQTLGGVGSMLAEATRDRYVGYPDDGPGYELDWFVPFGNSRTQANAYPVVGGPELPLDWQLESDLFLTDDGALKGDYAQHYFGNRSQWYAPMTKVTTAAASYFFQGACNPAAAKGDADYLQGCTAQHNNATTGGAVRPTHTNKLLQEKARNLQWALKPLWESHQDVKQLGVYFANDGAGAALTFPGQQFDGRATYTSIGCQWLEDLNVPMGNTKLETAMKHCHAAGQVVTTREYNPLERAWCKDQVQRKLDSAKTYNDNPQKQRKLNATTTDSNIFNSQQDNTSNNNNANASLHFNTMYHADAMDTIHFSGPYLDAIAADPLWVITLGQAVFDRRSNNFIACTLVDVSVLPLYDTLRKALVGATSQLALIRFNPTGDVIVATQWNPAVETTTTVITDPKLLMGVDAQLWNEWYTLVDFESGKQYDPAVVKEEYKQTIKVRDGRYSMMYPMPPMPKEYDKHYKPLYAVIVTMQLAEALDVVDEMSNIIDADVLWTMQQIAATGVIGIVVMALVIAYIAASLTKPLQWMQFVASRIIDNAGGADLGKGLQLDKNAHTPSPKRRRGGFVSSDDEDENNDGGDDDKDDDDDDDEDDSYDPNAAIKGVSSADDDSEDSYDPNTMEVTNTGKIKKKFGLISKEAYRMMDSRDAHPRCAPHTEVSLLVNVFETMMKTFSQEGAAEVASTKLNEVQHNFQWRSLFKSVYDPNNRMYNLKQLDKLRNPKKMAIAAVPANLKSEKGSGHSFRPGSANDPLMGNTTVKSHTSRRMGDGSQTNETDVSSFEDEHDDLGMPSSHQPLAAARPDGAAETISGLPLEPLPIPPISSINSLASFIYFAKALRTHPTVQTIENHPMWGHIKEYAIEYATLAATKVSEYLPESFQTGATTRNVGEEEPKPPTQNSGPNVDKTQEVPQYLDSKKAERSYLFWWTTILIATPIMATSVMVSWIVAVNVANRIPDWMEHVQVMAKTLELESIRIATLSRALLGEQVMSRFVRDLHLYTRLAGWLLFGGISHAPGVFTELATGAEQCKVYYEPLSAETCPFFLAKTSVCDCAWQDATTDVCEIFDPMVEDTRYLMRSHYEGQAHDADPVTGARVKSSFPLVDDTPANTLWWNDINTMPGAEKGDAAAGYETTYDRVRILASMTPANAMIYSYDPGLGESKHLGTYVGMAADGMMGGWAGCDYSHADYPQFVSSESNKAYVVAPDLCPLGDYGYDCRCRGWYRDGKEAGTLHITPPYEFSDGDTYAASATYPLVDPKTKEHIGQSLLDFLPNGFMQAVNANNTIIGHGQTGFAFVLTPHADVLGGNTLVAPGYKVTMSEPIGKMILPLDGEFSENRLYFDRVVVDNAMKAGLVGKQTFIRLAQDGTQEEVFVSYAPVNVHNLDPIDASNFAAGCQATTELIYSLGLAVVEEDLALPFNQVEKKVNDDIYRIMYIAVGLMAVAIILVIYMTYSMSMRVSQPVIVLIEIVRSIQDKTLGDEIPRIYGGSWEILSVYESLEKLCKIVRFSNAAFLAGDRQKSYKVMQDALDLFVKMGNQKALGVANNNIGAMILQEIQEDPSCSHDRQLFEKGVRTFEEAIRIGLSEYENAVDDEYQEKGNYIKQLANRYFNRGMFFVTNRSHPEAPSNIMEIGTSDINEAKRLDQEATAYWKEKKILCEKYAVQEFDTILRRARGVLALLRSADGFHDVYGFEELLEQAQKMVDDPEYRRQSKLFDTINKVGRQQQIDDLRIQYELYKGNTYGAARMAMRILVEDEYVIDTVLLNAATAVNKHFPQLGKTNNEINMTQFIHRETKRGHVAALRDPKNVILCLDHSSSMGGDRIKRALKDMMSVYEEHCVEKDHVAFVRFNQSVDDRLWFPFGRKGMNQEEHLRILNKAKDTEGGGRLYFALNRCVTIAQESEGGKDNDKYIIVFTHGEFSWDNPSASVINRIVQNNKKPGGKQQIHVIIVGYDIARPKSLKAISSVSEHSMFVDAKNGIDEIDNAFGLINDVIGGTAITMESF